MNRTDIHRVAITTLSPVHIGCDEVFEPTNFVIENGLLYLLDPVAIAQELDDKERAQLMRLADERDPIGPIQLFFKTHRSRLASIGTQCVDVAPDIAHEYETKAGRPQQKDRDGRPVLNTFPMARTAFNPLDGAPYLPGSSLKGSIRTAWLSHLNQGKPAQAGEDRAPAKLQQRLLGYAPGKFENDPFRLLGVADAHPAAERNAPPTRIVYAVSKKKRPSERGSPELKVFLETVREAMPDAFDGELRFAGNDMSWTNLCDACNAFYRPQLEAELDHEQFRPLLAGDWRNLISRLLSNELGDLMKARQGFLLRVGKHSGAESVTLEGVRAIKILGAKGEKPSYRPATTEKRFASVTRAASENLLPFGWIWISGCDDAHQHVAIAITDQIARHSEVIRQAHADRVMAFEARREAQAQAQRETIQRRIEAEAAAQAEVAAQQARQAALAEMSANLRLVEEFKALCETRAAQLGSNREPLNGNLHNRGRQLATAASEGADWSAEEKLKLADVLAEWLPKLVARMDKDQLKKLKLAALRGG